MCQCVGRTTATLLVQTILNITNKYIGLEQYFLTDTDSLIYNLANTNFMKEYQAHTDTDYLFNVNIKLIPIPIFF